MSDVVICSAHPDREIARACGERLRAAGFDVDWSRPPRIKLRSDEEIRPELAAAKVIIAILSDAALGSRRFREEVDIAAVTGRLVVVKAPGIDAAGLPSELREFDVGTCTNTERLADALRALGVAGGDGMGEAIEPIGDAEMEDHAWAYVDKKGSAKLIQLFLGQYPDGAHAEQARQKLTEIIVPDGDGIQLTSILGGVALALALIFTIIVFLVPTRAMVQIPVAAGGADGLYLRMLQQYNQHLRPHGVELVPDEAAKSAFSNVQQLTNGRVKAAFLKGGFAGALRDPDFLTDDRIKVRGKEWDQDWSAKLDKVVSLGRVALEPLWVFTFGAAESNQLAELEGEPVGLGSMQSGGRTLSALMLEKNGVRFQPELWLDGDAPTPKPGDAKPLGVARAVFLQQPAESPQVQALLQNLAPERQFDRTKNIRAAAFAPNGDQIAVVLGDKTVRVIDAFSGEEHVALKGHTENVNDIAFSPDGKRIATASDDNTVRMWDAKTGQAVGEPLKEEDDVNGVSFSPDGKRIASASEGDWATVWDVASGKALLRLEGTEDSPGHTDDVNSAMFSPDGKRVVTASRDGTARIWDASNGAQLIVLRGHTKPISRAVFSKDGKLVATASWDNTGRIWDAATGRVRMILSGHEDLLRSVEFSPDGKMVITASWDDSARVWEVATGRQIRRINGIRSNVNGVGFSPDGAVVMTASQDTTVRIWDAKTWEKVADFRADGQTHAGVKHDSGRALHLMDFSKDAEAYMIRFPYLSTVRLPRGAVAFEPHVPAEPVTLLATSTAFVVDRDWAAQNPSLVRVITDAIVHKPLPGIDETTRRPRLFYKSGQFPTLSDPELEVSPVAAPIYRTGDLPFVLSRLTRFRIIPFGWAAWLDEHAGTLVFSLIPLLGVLIPLVRFIPTLYNWTVRRRILYWYRRLHAIERQLDRGDRTSQALIRNLEIDRIDNAVSRIRVPLSYTDQYYDLRAHIDLVRQRLISRAAAGPRSGARAA